MTNVTTWWHLPLSKGAAFTVHMLLSLLVFSSLVVVMWLYWFPGDLFFIDGGWQGLKLVAMVDLVLGPALTLLLYKPGKPKLALDMSLIAAIQVAALGYGFYTTHQQRTVAIVFAERTFNTVSASDKLEADELLRERSVQPQPIPSASLMTLPLLITPVPLEGGYGKILEDSLNGYPSPAMRNDQYVPVASHHHEMRQHALTKAQLQTQGALVEVEAALTRRSLDSADVELYRFSARYAEGVAIFHPLEKRIVDYVTVKTPEVGKQKKVEDIADGEAE